VIACGAIAQHCTQLVVRHGWPMDVYPLPPLLHNHPEQIAAEIEPLAGRLRRRYDTVAIGYADCGSYGAIDGVCNRLGLRRLNGLHCYDVFAGADRFEQLLADQPGTYLLTDFLVRSFARTVIAELGLDRYPQLRTTYFGNYTRVVWLAQERTPELEAQAVSAAGSLGLPLTVLDVGLGGLEAELAALMPPV
jgi:Protein of unknown function (DUF1638)